MLGACAEDGIHGYVPTRAMCTDNAAMIAAAGWPASALDGPTRSTTAPTPTSSLRPA